MDKISIIVVLYNCEIKNSQTLTSLIDADITVERSNLIIWNNGPKVLEDKKVEDFIALGFKVTVEETIDNQSLAKIYNAFIHKYPAKHYIILDDDSTLNPRYLKQTQTLEDVVIGYPMIVSSGKPCSPKINKSKLANDVALESVILKATDKVEAIGSGLIINDSLANKIKLHYGDIFDERFYIYGVDTTFCWRVSNMIPNHSIKILYGFSHSISRNDKESKAVKLFRKTEKANAKGLKIHHYKNKFVRWLKATQLSLSLCIPFYRRQINKEYLSALVSGKHAKDRKDS